MKVGLFSPYLDTIGGGERYFLTAAEFFLKRGDNVNIFWRDASIKTVIEERLNIDIGAANFVNNFSTLGYDVIFFLSDGSIPLSFARRTIVHFQVPFTNIRQNLLTRVKLLNSVVICNSNFTKKFIDKTFSINSRVIYPPVDTDNFTAGAKENIILGVGRFFAPLHPKKQEVMVEAFKKLNRPAWQLVLIGGVTGDSSQKMVEDLRKKAAGFNIKVITDSSFDVLRGFYSRAKIFWHAAGYSEDLEKYPERAEHFGITTVEAMAAGCVPIVFAGGGQKEIVENGKNGYLWNDLSQLQSQTLNLISGGVLLNKVSKNAVLRSNDFSKEKFFSAMDQVI